MPTFAASVITTEQSFVGINATARSSFHDIGFKYDSSIDENEWHLSYGNFGLLGPAFDHLEVRQICKAGNCTVSDRNGTLCYEGQQANLRVLSTLWSKLLTDGGDHLGPAVVEGEGCERWHVGSAALGNLSMCIRSDGVWKSLVVEPSVAAVGSSNVIFYSFNLTTTNVTLVNTAVKIEPISCPKRAPEPCEGQGVAAFQVLRASNGEPWAELQDRDTFDWAGLAVTLGVSGFSGKKFLEVFDVEADTSWGPWRDCNYKPVLHRNECQPASAPELARLVARSSAEQLTGSPGVLGDYGQCDANELVGSWLVFPSAGECRNGSSVGYGGCTWRSTRAKVVSMECLQSFDSQAVQRAWAEEYRKPPFPRTLNAAKAAMAGCPDVRLI